MLEIELSVVISTRIKERGAIGSLQCQGVLMRFSSQSVRAGRLARCAGGIMKSCDDPRQPATVRTHAEGKCTVSARRKLLPTRMRTNGPQRRHSTRTSHQMTPIPFAEMGDARTGTMPKTTTVQVRPQPGMHRFGIHKQAKQHPSRSTDASNVKNARSTTTTRGDWLAASLGPY